MEPLDTLMLDAKQAILDAQHHRFRALQEAGQWEEAMRQFQQTLVCACDLLHETAQVLQKMLDKPPSALPPPPSPEGSR